MHCRRVLTPVEQLQPFGRSRIVGFREVGLTYRRISAHVGPNVSVVCCCFRQWSVEHFHTRRPGSGRPLSTDARQDRRIMRAAVAARIVPYPGNKSGYMFHLLCHQEPLRIVCLQQNLDHACLWPGYHSHHDTPKHGYSVIVNESTGEWNGPLLSSVMRVSSVCMRVMEVHVYGVDLVSVIFRSALPKTHRPHLRLHGVREH